MARPRGRAKKLAEEHDAQCPGQLVYSEKVDTFVCYICKTLLESDCPDQACEFCVERKIFFGSK